MPLLPYLAIPILAYLIGAIPLAYLITRLLTGRDIRKLGSGNVGVMNTIRQAGFPAGMLVFAGEGTKGAAVYSLGRYFSNSDERLLLLSGIAAAIGVNWSIFVGFSGGRGTTFSTFFIALVAWKVVVLGALIWLAVYLACRDTFLATRANIVLLPLTVFAVTQDWTMASFAVAGSLIMLVRHRRETDDRLQISQPVA